MKSSNLSKQGMKTPGKSPMKSEEHSKKDSGSSNRSTGPTKQERPEHNAKQSNQRERDTQRGAGNNHASRGGHSTEGNQGSQSSQQNKDEKKFTGRCRLFVGNLTPDVSEDDFKKLFEPFGDISEVYVNTARGFGFIRLDYRHNAEAAKAALDGMQRKGRTLRVRFATHGAALRVKNIHGYASNELLESAFSQFGELERAIVIVDDRGKPTGEGIVEFVRKPGAQQALRRINDGVFLLGSSPRPLYVEPLEQKDEDDGMPEKFLNKNDQYKKEREKEPRFAAPGSFEFEFGQRWKQVDEMEKERLQRVQKEMEEARLKLEDEMQGALYEYQAEQIRQDLMRQQEELRRLEEMRQQDQMRRRQEMEMRRQEEERRQDDDRRRQEMMMRQDMSRRGPMDQGPRGGRGDEMMGGMRDGPGPRGREGAPPLPPPPAPPAGMGLDRSGRGNQIPGGNMGGGFGGPGNMSGGGMGGQGSMGSGPGNMGGSGSSGSSLGGMGPNNMRQSRFEQQSGGNFDGGFGSGGGMGGPNQMGGNMGGGQGGPGNMFNSGMGNNMGSGGQGMRGERGGMDRRREGGPRDDFDSMKRMRRF